jgi:quercetin 2,3-dioxygenase
MSKSLISDPVVTVRRAADRHQTRTGWLHGRHSFDTGIDPLGTDTHHGVLVVNNHDTIAPLPESVVSPQPSPARS